MATKRYGMGARAGYFAHELDHYFQNILRQAKGLPLLPEPEMPPPSDLSFVSLQEAQRRTGMTSTTLWRWEKDGRFPKRISTSLPAPGQEWTNRPSPGRPRKDAADNADGAAADVV